MVQLEFGLVSSTGCVRDHNEDNYYFFGSKLDDDASEHGGLAAHALSNQLLTVAIFDGMGGEAAGEIASAVASTALGEYINDVKRWDEERIRSAYIHMNEAVVAAGISQRAPSMGATAVMLSGSDGKVWVSNLGDSPAMLLEGTEIITVSEAHTDEELMRTLGVVQRKPGLTQYLGIDSYEMTIEPHIMPLTLRAGQCLLLCSDGLTDMVANADIIRILKKDLPAIQKASALKGLAIQHGGRDNVTIAVCNVGTEGNGIS